MTEPNKTTFSLTAEDMVVREPIPPCPNRSDLVQNTERLNGLRTEEQTVSAMSILVARSRRINKVKTCRSNETSINLREANLFPLAIENNSTRQLPEAQPELAQTVDQLNVTLVDNKLKWSKVSS